MISPIDLIPGIIPVVGQLDDMLIALGAIRLALNGLKPEARAERLAAAGLTHAELDTDIRTTGAVAGWLGRDRGPARRAGGIERDRPARRAPSTVERADPRERPITFEIASGGATHAPLLIAVARRLGPSAVRRRLGSEVHLLNEDLADELGLAKQPGEEGTDHAGNTMPSWSVGDVPAVVDGLDLVLRDAVAIPAPPPFPGFGIRGILSPQNLHPERLDGHRHCGRRTALLEATDEQEAADYLRARSPALQLLTLRRDADFPSLVVPAALDGFAEMPTMLNTGGKQTEYSAAALPGLRPQSTGRLGGGVSGADYVGWIGRTADVARWRGSSGHRGRSPSRADARAAGHRRHGRIARHGAHVGRRSVTSGLLADPMTRRLIVQEFMALDGVMQAPGFEEHPDGKQGWVMRRQSPETQQFIWEVIDTVDTFLLGRTTYLIWASFWPTAAGDAGKVGRRIQQAQEGRRLLDSHRPARGRTPRSWARIGRIESPR